MTTLTNPRPESLKAMLRLIEERHGVTLA